MSLSKIGKLTSAFSSFKNNPLDLTNMATALASVGNVDNAAKYLVKINKQNGNFLGENAMAVLLSKAYRSSGINQEMAMGSINNALANSSKFSMGGMLGSLSAVGTGIATMFESIAPVIIPLIIAAVAAKAGKMAWDNFATNTAAKKQYQTSSKAYQEAASERDSVQSEYDSNKERTLGNLFTKYANPQRGDIVIFYRNGTFAHTGIVTKVEGDKFYTIEGNTSAGSTVVPNGGGVFAKSYYNSNLPGTKFCRPDYSIVTSILTSPAPVQPSYTAWVGSCTANGTDVFSDATGASKLSTYPKLNAGNLVDIIGESGTRYQVRIAAKYIGYVEKSNIKNPNTPAATTTKKYPFVGKVTASKLNVRKKPGTEHPLLPEYPMLNKDNLINVLGVTKDTKGDRWYKVSITKKEYIGYVSAKYITKA